MKGLDTNVLARYLVQDDPKQSAKAADLIEQVVDEGGKLLLAPVVLCELVWVLESAYDSTREEVIGALDKILRTAQFEIVTKDIMWKAWESYRDGKGDFADYCVGHQCHDAGASVTLTFDKVLGQSNLFEVLKA